MANKITKFSNWIFVTAAVVLLTIVIFGTNTQLFTGKLNVPRGGAGSAREICQNYVRWELEGTLSGNPDYNPDTWSTTCRLYHAGTTVRDNFDKTLCQTYRRWETEGTLTANQPDSNKIINVLRTCRGRFPITMGTTVRLYECFFLREMLMRGTLGDEASLQSTQERKRACEQKYPGIINATNGGVVNARVCAHIWRIGSLDPSYNSVWPPWLISSCQSNFPGIMNLQAHACKNAGIIAKNPYAADLKAVCGIPVLSR